MDNVHPIKPWPSEAERTATADAASAHLPVIPENLCLFWSDADVAAMRAAFRKRFNEDVPRTETLFAVAAIGYRASLRDLQGWREHDWPEGFDRRTAEIMAQQFAGKP